VHADDGPDVGVTAPELLDEQDVRHRVAATTAVLLRDGQAEKAGLAEPVQRLLREALGAVVVQSARHDDVVDPLPYRLLHGALLGGQRHVHALSLAVRPGAHAR